jgi:ABC-type polysaccharide/polyol phosphate transport system ATPase subunit
MVDIDLDRVSLEFTVRRYKRLSLKEFLVRGMFSKAANPVIRVQALKDVSLRVDEGERVGVIGHNGAGKSTLLKLLAGIYPPTDGSRTVNGRISSLFDITLGFEQDASGWENIYYRSYLQGETPQSVRGKVQDIAAFSELGEFLDMPVRYYSAGMMIRLAFAIATAIEPEILIVDEVLSVGDLAFQQKATDRIRAMMAQARLMVIVSHDLDRLRELCSRIVWMDRGQVRTDGAPAATIAAYQQHFQRAAA